MQESDEQRCLLSLEPVQLGLEREMSELRGREARGKRSARTTKGSWLGGIIVVFCAGAENKKRKAKRRSVSGRVIM